MSTDRIGLSRQAAHENEAPGDLLRRYLAAAGWQAIGYVLLSGGFVALLIGWLGVSREAIVAKQIPYLVSGGLGGAFMLGVGALLLITHELRLDNRRLEAVETLMEELRDALLLDEDMPGVLAASEQRASATVSGSTDTGAVATNGHAHAFAVVEGGSRYHLPTCASTAGKNVTYVSDESLRTSGLKPCRLCGPDNVATMRA